jgi:hypothetical protein
MVVMLKQKPQYSQWVSKLSPIPKKAQSLVQCESDAGCFFYCEGIMHHEFLSHGQTVDKEYYLKVMKRLRGSEEKNAWFVPS